ncbi:hypothetical protein [Amycolatopsis sp. NPDC098790]|uniref:hypothetical protein n=1 Tax=Amycolatopsis sp. NPDC098790 TaxID=3363939 RepID=UPI00381E15C5
MTEAVNGAERISEEVAVGIQRKDERHNEKLVDEISEGFNRAVGEKKDEDEAPKPRFVITGDARATPPPRRRQR